MDWLKKNYQGIILTIGILLPLWFFFYDNTKGNANNSRVSSNNDFYSQINPEMPVIGIQGTEINYFKNVVSLNIKNEGSNIISSRTPANDIITKVIIQDESQIVYKNLDKPIYPGEDYKLEIGLDSFSGPTKITLKCEYIGKLTLTDNSDPECKVKGSSVSTRVDAPSFAKLKLLGLDATRSNDTIDLLNVQDFFSLKNSDLRIVQIAGDREKNNVITINSPKLFKDQKKRFFIFFNDEKYSLNDPQVQYVKHKLLSFFPYLTDVNLFTFTDFISPGKPEESDVNWIKSYIGDCSNLEIHKNGCGKEDRIFTKRMINNNLDFFFLVPRVMNME